MLKRRKEQPTYEQLVKTFVKSCGLRRTELERLRVRDFYRKKRDFFYELQWIHVAADGDIPEHEVPFLECNEWVIASLTEGLAPDDLVFSHLPELDYEALREAYAYEYFLGEYETIGAMEGSGSLHEVGQHVKQALGLPRLDKTRQAWLRWARRAWKRRAELF
jgi:hypothetical protein